jgi:hypothetical protein
MPLQLIRLGPLRLLYLYDKDGVHLLLPLLRNILGWAPRTWHLKVKRQNCVLHIGWAIIPFVS